jgi:hypothetical protein
MWADAAAMEPVSDHVGQLVAEDLGEEVSVPVRQMGGQADPTLDRPA